MFGKGCEGGMCGPGMEGAPRGGMCVVRIGRVERQDYADMLMEWAKTEIVKEKVKAKLEAKYGKQLDKLADTIVDVMVERSEGRKKAGQKEQKMKEAEDELPFDDGEIEVL
ncbi:MAG: hypothetical protein WC759_00285 [Candidatus Micrarchaeia archaeon]|jgi:hypothetical protein